MTALYYARVSSGRQENEETIQSQVAELRARMMEDGVAEPEGFTDEGYSRDNLVRPGLDHIRDLATQGPLKHLYIHCPDRLASGAKLMFLVEDIQKAGVEVIFLKGAVEDTPEGKLMLHMQGAIAEYERTKIVERTRRGKMYWARQGALIGGYFPYGYRYIARDRERNLRATLEVDELQAPVVRDIFRLLVEERLSCRAIAKRLTEEGVLTQTGKNRWTPGSINRMLRQSAYKGTSYYHRTEAVEPRNRSTQRPYAKTKLTSKKLRPKEEWIAIPVPAIVDEQTWETAQEQLRQNFIHSPRNNKRRQYLLSGLIRCTKCGATYVGGSSHDRQYYHCNQLDPLVSKTGERCRSPWLRADKVEEPVWQAVADALRQPETLVEEYEKRVEQSQRPNGEDVDRKQLEVALRRLKSQENRVTDAYINEAMELPDYKQRMDQIREDRRRLEGQMASLEKRRNLQDSHQEALARLENFCENISIGLEHLAFEEKQALLRLLVERITVEGGRIRIEAAIPLGQRPTESSRLRPPSGNPKVADSAFGGNRSQHKKRPPRS